MPYKMRAPNWKVKRGKGYTLTFESSEPLKGKPVVLVSQEELARI